jgi:hypothetical protein
LHELPALLSWAAGGELLPKIAEFHLLWTEKRLYSWSQHAKRDLMPRVSRLAPLRRERFLRAPALATLLRSSALPGEGHIQRIEDWLAIEEYLSERHHSAPVSGWTAANDFQIESNGEATATKARNTVLQFAPGAQATIFDTESPTTGSGWIMKEMGSLVLYDDQERSAATELMENSRLRIAAFDPAVGALVACALGSIESGKSPSQQALFASQSARRNIGLATLFNLHCGLSPVDQVVDALVHESIHSMLYKLELIHPFYTDQNAALYTKVASPWTGRILELHSFVHACFVWYGLLMLWSRASEPSSFGQQAKERARRGFLAAPLREAVAGEPAQAIHPEVYGVLERLFQEVRG